MEIDHKYGNYLKNKPWKLMISTLFGTSAI